MDQPRPTTRALLAERAVDLVGRRGGRSRRWHRLGRRCGRTATFAVSVGVYQRIAGRRSGGLRAGTRQALSTVAVGYGDLRGGRSPERHRRGRGDPEDVNPDEAHFFGNY